MNKVTTEELKTLMDTSTNYTMVDVYADWCAPCKRMTPVLESIEPTFETLNMVKIDADAEHTYSAEVGIRSIPTLVMYNSNGDEVDRWTGNQDPTEVNNWIQEALTK